MSEGGLFPVKITDVKVYPIMPDAPVWPTGVTHGWVFVAVETDEGITGYGECTNSPRRGPVAVLSARLAKGHHLCASGSSRSPVQAMSFP